jgi:hypothetical protein
MTSTPPSSSSPGLLTYSTSPEDPMPGTPYFLVEFGR